MLAGRVPFGGESFASTVAAVLRTEPDWSGVPPVIHRMLAACLEKDPRLRLRDVGDAWRLLEGPTRAPEVAGRRWPLAAAIGLAAGAAIAWVITRPLPSAPAPVTRWSITLVEPGGGERGLALSRDGRLLAYTVGRCPGGLSGYERWTRRKVGPFQARRAAGGRSSHPMEDGSPTSAALARARS